MKRIEVLGIILFCVFFFLISSAFLPASFQFRPVMPVAINTRITVNEDGILDVVELINLSDTARGSFVQFILPHPPSRVSDLVVTRIWPFHAVLEETQPDELSELKRDEVWIIREEDEFQIFVRNSQRREDVSYIFEFKLHNAVTNHFDTAQIQYPRLKPGARTRIVSWHAEVIFFNEAEMEDIMAWFRNDEKGYLHGRAGELDFQMESKPEYNKSYLHMLAPTQLVPDNSLQSLTASLSNLIESEQKIDQLINEREEARVNASYIALLFFLFSFLYIFRHWCINIRCFDRHHKNKIQETPPDIYRPAEVGLMIRYGKLIVRDLISTLFSLAVSGYIKIEQYLLFVKKNGHKDYALDYRIRLTGKPLDGLTEYEKVLIDELLCNFSPGENFISLYEVEKVFIRNPVAYSKFWNKWTQTLKKRNIVLRLFDRRIDQKQHFFFRMGWTILIMGIITLTLVLFFLTDFSHLIAIPFSFFMSGLLIIIMSFLFKKRSKKTQDEYLRLMAYKRYLSDLKKYYENKPLPPIHHFEQAIPFAIAWSMESQFIMTLKDLYMNTGRKEILGQDFYKSCLESELDTLIYKNLLFAIDAFVFKFAEGLRAIKGYGIY